jgi:DNA-directed RNA polymerase specialized sigma24 family protein
MRANLNFFKPEIPDAAQLRVAVASLPTPFRKTLVLRDIEGLDCREISDAIEVATTCGLWPWQDLRTR